MDIYPILTSMRFMLLWIPGSLLAMGITLVTAFLTLLFGAIILGYYYLTGGNTLNPVTHLIALGAFAFIGAVMGLTTGSIQQALMRQKFRGEFRGWRLVSTMSGALGLLLSALALGVPLRHALATLTLPDKGMFLVYGAVPVILPLTCLGIAQWFVLQRYVYGAWAWILANVVAGIVFFSLMVAMISGGVVAMPILAFAVVASPAIVTGFAMLWLLQFNARSMFPDDFN